MNIFLKYLYQYTFVPNIYKTCRKTSSGQIEWRPSWMLPWLSWKPPGCQIFTLAKNKLQTSSDTIQPRNALDKNAHIYIQGLYHKSLFAWEHRFVALTLRNGTHTHIYNLIRFTAKGDYTYVKYMLTLCLTSGPEVLYVYVCIIIS